MFKSIVAAALALLTTLATPLHAAEQLPEVIRFGISSAGVGKPPRVNTGWISVAQLHRYLENEFAKDGVKIEWIFFKGQGPAVNEAVSNNQLDFTTLGDLPAIVSRSVGVDTRAILGSARADVYVVARPGAGIRGIADLRGKRVAYHKGTATQLAAARLFAAHGLSEKDVRVINMEPGTAKAALLSGDVDAIFGSLELVNFRDSGRAVLVYSSRTEAGPIGQGFVLVNQQFARQHPQATTRVVKALLRAAQWSSDPAHRDEVFKLWASAGAVPEATYRREYQGIALADRFSPLLDAGLAQRTRQAATVALQHRLIRKPIDVESWFDRRYLDAALRELGLVGYWG
ncbi:ABC transporter substrate-binding protein [Chitiniphilus shinanonensis]|uniref:ABC transporter substrate-binding protein n=1 Tax=Chitiniphilus shinanonensis TaxID=553088 RepID=UPI00302F34EB